MSRDEVKVAIDELLKNKPDQVLEEILEYLKAVEGKAISSISLSQNLRTILTEDAELLDRLAK